jgi:hypothetical protein
MPRRRRIVGAVVRRTTLRFLVAAFALTTAACPSGGGSGRAARGGAATDASTTTKPRLVVLLVIDHFPEWAFEVKRPELGRGFARLLAEGQWRVGRHPSMATVTAPGHALLGTGEPPARSGIIANTWWSREENRMVSATLGADDATSTRFLRVPGLGDAIASSRSGAKAVGVALKVRAARLPLGQHGLAVYYDGKTGTWQSHGTSTPPPWLARYATEHPLRLTPWTPQDPARLAKLSGTDDAQRGEVGEKGFGPTFPHDPASTKQPTDAVYAMPLGNDLVLDTATAALAGEQLGTDATPDLLVISLSAHDYIAHGWGHESWEAWDAELRLDARLDEFLSALDAHVGRDRWAMVVTSDHGGSPLPERVGGGRYSEQQIQRAANAAVQTVLGPGDWIASASWPNVYFSPAALTQNKRELANAYKKIIFALRSFPGLAVVDRTDAFAGNCDSRSDEARTICLALDLQRSGELFYVPAPGWIIDDDDERLATAHGSFHDYDRLVPVFVLPPGRTRHAPGVAPTGPELSLAEIAPLVAGWLGVPAPATLPR